MAQVAHDRELLEEAMGLAADGTLAHLRRLLPDGFDGYVGKMNRWTGRYERSERYVPHDPGWLLGRLWVLFAHTQDDEFEALALRILRPMVPHLVEQPIGTLGSGIDIFFGLCLGAQVTGSDELRELAVRASANVVSSLWSERDGRFLCFPRGTLDHREVPSEWGGCLYHLPWTSDAVPAHLACFVRHQETILSLGLIRPDGSTYHAAHLGDDGRVERFETFQGWRPESTWARGQSWVMHSFVAAAELTASPTLAGAARRVIAWWLDNLPPDWVPFYDFADPQQAERPRDSCAAAMGLSALMRLRPEADDQDRVDAAVVGTLDELCRNYLSLGGVLLHSSLGNVGDRLYTSPVSHDPPPRHAPGGFARCRFPQEDVMVYGNYFIVETLYRALHGAGRFPSLLPGSGA
jgi:unsaturated chondroitin disaccharide hydrolase